MAVIQSGVTTDVATVDPTTKAIRASIRTPEGEHYRIGSASGLFTGVAAATATAGHLFSFRWGSATEYALIWRVVAKVVTVAGYTAAQEVGIDLIKATAYTASHTGGTALTLTTTNGKKRTGSNVTGLTSARIATTGALTAGTHTLDAQALAFGGFSELAAGAAVPKGVYGFDFNADPDYGGPLILAQDEGFIIRNLILQGAGGTARLYVEVDWSEVTSPTAW